MRVALVAPRFAPDVGGMESYAGWVARLLRDAPGTDVDVITTRRGLRTRVDTVDGTRVVRLGTWGIVSNTPISPLWPWQLRRWFRRLGTDVVNAHSPVPLFADAATYVSGHRPVVLTYHAGSLLKGAGGLVDRLLGAYERHVLPRVFARSAALVAVSPVSMAHRTGRAVLVPPGVDVDLFHPGGSRRDAGARLLYVGRVETTSRWKGLHVLIDALPEIVRRVPDAVLDVVGTGDAVPGLAAQARRLGVDDRVVWHGALPPSQVAERYRDARVTVLPSLTESESFGMSLVEAMASGCAVVGSRVGGIPFVVREQVDGVLTEPGDADALADTVATLLLDPRRCRRLGAAGRAAAEERWDWRHQREATLAVLRDAAFSATPAPHEPETAAAKAR